MEITKAAQIFTALGHPGRLSVFRMVMRLAPIGGRPTEMAEALGLKPNTLSHYLGELEACGLLHCERQGRSLIYTVDLASAGGLIDFLVNDCCRGRPDLYQPADTRPRMRTMDQAAYNVLFICSGNSARSIFAEALLCDLGQGRFQAFSAGTRPNSRLNAFALQILTRNGHATHDLRSKHITEFQRPDAPQMDFVFTVCDKAASEECPPWPGQPISGHWGLPDPVKAQGNDAEKALVFAQTYAALRRRILAFAALPFAQLDRIALQRQVDALSTDPT